MRRARIVRLLTLLSFFHFSGLNNGFTFIAAQAQSVQPIAFAPVALRSLCSAVNPFIWKSSLRRLNLKQILFGTSKVLSVSSKNALQKYHPSLLAPDLHIRSTKLNELVVNLFSFQRVLCGKPLRGFPQSPQATGPPIQNAGMKINLQQIHSVLWTVSQTVSQSISGPSHIQTHHHAILKRTDERKPDDEPDLSPLNFILIPIPSVEFRVTHHKQIERQASLPASQKLRLWRHARGVGEDSPSFYFGGRSPK